MMRDGKDHTREDRVTLSGTKVREMLSKGIAPPPEFSRPEVATIVMEHCQSTLSFPHPRAAASSTAPAPRRVSSSRRR